MHRRYRSFTSSTRFHVNVAGSMSRRANLAASSSVRSSGSVFSIPSFFSLASIGFAKVRIPFFGGHSRLNSALSLCVASWNILASIAAASRLLAAVTAWMSPVRWRLNSVIGMTCE